KETIWVGDPKQAIYSFRGAVTTLMTETLKKVPDDENDDISDEKEKHRKTLKDSHRSKRELVELSNRVFTRAFLNTHDKNDVRLGVERKDPEGGKISSWLLVTNAKRASDTTGAKALAAGIAKLMDQEEFKQKGYKPSDIAVLCRTGAHCKAVSSALAERNIPSTNSSGKLLDTIECQLVLSAYQCALDKRNILAATRYAVLSGEKNSAELFGSMVEKRQKGESLQETFQFLEERFSRIGKRDGVIDLTPGELLERVIQTLNLDRLIDRMKFPEARRCNLDALRKAANDYLQIASAGGLSTSPAGFLAWIHGADLDAATAVGGKLVQVMTYHTAKGLEWPIVILYSLNWTKKLRERIFQTRALSVDHFLPENPLEGRSIHCWPYPFGKSGVDELKAKLEEETSKESLVKKLNDLDVLDAKNLFYVGVTRARDHVIFAMRAKFSDKGDKVYNQWIDDVAPGVFHWPTVEGETKDDDGWLRKTGFTPEGEEWEPVAENLTLETNILSADAPIDPTPAKPIFLDLLPEQKDFLPAVLKPSEAGEMATEKEKTGQVNKVYVLNVKSPDLKKLKDDFSSAARLGNAFHQYFELHPKDNRLTIARDYLKAWDCLEEDGLDSCAEVLESHEKALYDWIKKYCDGQVLCEVPITLTNSEGQRYQGSIDMLIETDEGYVIIDHKTHYKKDDKPETYAAKQWAQLNIYRQAVEKATGKKVAGTYIHLPMYGMICEVNAGDAKTEETPSADAQ
ncbi:MAG: PD-(D/E)XK nuclease family protein, partial [Thermoguttaceae bacterium]|nr:PD-(D/E)XK nuclease family protein [Thermoguttaceae bacterium]